MAKQTEPGKCPDCGSMNVTYEVSHRAGDMLGYEFSCDDCKKSFIEWFSLTYVETLEK